MKKRGIFLLCLFLGLLSGCADTSLDDTKEAVVFPDSIETTMTIETEESTEAPTESETEQTSEAPTEPETEHTTEAPTEPETEQTTEAPTEPETERTTEESTEPVTQPAMEEEVLLYEDMKAMWLSQYDLASIYQAASAQRNVSDFTERMAQVFDNIKAQGFNTVFLQVRPNGDSMGYSQYYPMSSYVTGMVGRDAQYDPVEIMVELAHERALSIHAWINPMRAMKEKEILTVPESYLIRQWYEDEELRGKYIVSVKGTWYLNPAYAPVANLIVNGAEELMGQYDFDGLHMDDYFYPTTDPSFDAAAYDQYCADGGSLGLAEFRRDVLNRLVQQLYTMTRESRTGRIFGISPAGNLDTVYNSQFADVYRWCGSAGYIDYICPQVYFGLEHGSFDFVKVSKQYQSMIKTDSVDLIVGMSFGKAFTQEDQWAGSGKNEWKDHKDVMARCLQATKEFEKCRGVSVFCYQYFFDPLQETEISQTAEERANFVPILKEISWQ